MPPPATPTRRIGRAITMVVSTVAGAVGMGWVCVDSWQLLHRTTSPSLDLVLATVTATGACAVLAWCALLVMVVALAAVPGQLGTVASIVGRWVAPAGARRRARLYLGVAVTTAQLGLVVLPGTAAPGPGTTSTIAVSAPASPMMPASGGTGSDDLPRIGRPPVSPPSVVVSAPREPTSKDRLRDDDSRRDDDAPRDDGTPRDDDAHTSEQRRRVTVEPGDTLWSIAADHLDTTPTTRAVSEAWPLWFAANRDVIGPDPDVIRPGAVLVEPAPAINADEE